MRECASKRTISFQMLSVSSTQEWGGVLLGTNIGKREAPSKTFSLDSNHPIERVILTQWLVQKTQFQILDLISY